MSNKKNMSAELDRKNLKVQEQRVILARLLSQKEQREMNGKDPLEECRLLAKTAGGESVGEILQTRVKPDPATLLGSGKVTALKNLAESEEAELVIFDSNLRPSQQRNLEKRLEIPVIDRTELILDIFATHAKTRQARLQIQLAQAEYSLPRLKRLWTHLHRERGGIGLRGGMGEKQIEVDKRLLGKRIQELKEELEDIYKRKVRSIEKRHNEFTISLVGYTNAGKSTLMKALTGSDVYIEDKLFATLDTKTRAWKMGRGRKVLLSDTVGFIRDLPHDLVESFKATLEEACQADLLLHVIDASSPDLKGQLNAVQDVLKEIGCANKETILVFNKIDQIEDHLNLSILKSQTSHTRSVSISAKKSLNLDELKHLVAEAYNQESEIVELNVPYSAGKLIAFLERETEILSRSSGDTGYKLCVRLQPRFKGELRRLGGEAIIASL